MGNDSGWGRGVKEAVDRGSSYVPECYVQREEDRPSLTQICNTRSIPVIDFQDFFDPSIRPLIVQAIASACEDWGCFQAVNHGVSDSVIAQIWSASKMFFSEPIEKRMHFRSEKFHSPVSYAIPFANQGQPLLWKDSLTFHYIPGEANGFAEGPPYTREAVVQYLKEMEKLVVSILQGLSENLGVGKEGLAEAQGGSVSPRCLQMHYYPKCPKPDITLGARRHSDIVTLTVLLQDEVGGLQVNQHGTWIPVQPIPNSLVINVGDQLEIITNAKFKSVEHRVVTNAKTHRMSIACFFGPAKGARIAPLQKQEQEKITEEEEEGSGIVVQGINGKPVLFREVVFEDYVGNYLLHGPAGRSNLDYARLQIM